MNGKFLEVLLATAVALSASNWGFKELQDFNQYTSYRPDELLSGQETNASNLRGTFSRQNLSFSTFKDDQNILDTIIHLEESQRCLTAIVSPPYTNYFAYPLISNSESQPSYAIDDLSPESPRHETLNSQVGSTEVARPSLWPLAPPSPIDDGGLFGAIGYAPLSDNQYFDIESFLNADFPTDVATDNAIDELFGSVAISRQSSVSSEQNESIDQLAQFLGASLETPTSPETIPKRGPKFPSQLLSNSKQSLETVSEADKAGHSFVKEISMPVNPTVKIGDIQKQLKDDYFAASLINPKESPIADVQSYGYVRQPSVILKKRYKKEPSSPTSQNDYLLNGNDFDCEGYASSSSSFDSSQNEQKGGGSVRKGPSKQIWLDLPYTKDDIINSKIEDFNDIITLLEPLRQHVAKEIRRKGKNKLAARNCRKRKIDAIDSLGVGVNELEQQKQMLLDERLQIQLERDEIVRKTEFLYEHIFKNLRDERGRPYSKDNFALTYTADGTVYLVPKTNAEVDRIGSR